MLFMMLMTLINGKFNLMRAMKYFFVVLLLSVVLLNISTIFFSVYDLISSFGYTSYALNQMKDYLANQDFINVLSGRSEIWGLAQSMIASSPLFGSGMGVFEDRMGFYSHSLYFDLVLFYGYTGLLFFAAMICWTVKKVLSFDRVNKMLAVLLLCLWCPKLFFSIYFIKEPSFWCFIALGFLSRQIFSNNGMVPVRVREE